MSRFDSKRKRMSLTRSKWGRRRTQVSQKASRKRSPQQTGTDMHALPPVMFRSNLAGLPMTLRKAPKSKARRRIDLTLSVPGAEMRLPAIPQITIGARWISFLLVAGLSLLLYYFWSAPGFQVNYAEILGLRRLDSRDVNAVLDLENVPIFTIDPRQIENNLREAFPEFASVVVEVGLPQSLQVTVEERVPILTWRQDGRTLLVDASGVAFPVRSQNAIMPSLVIDATSQPVLSDDAKDEWNHLQFMQVEMVSAILSMSAQAPKEIPLVYDPMHGLGWKDPNGWDVYFGDIRNMDVKSKIYQALVGQFEKDGIKPALVSVEYVHTPYYRMEQ